jgi:hypothetical protein
MMIHNTRYLRGEVQRVPFGRSNPDESPGCRGGMKWDWLGLHACREATAAPAHTPLSFGTHKTTVLAGRGGGQDLDLVAVEGL